MTSWTFCEHKEIKRPFLARGKVVGDQPDSVSVNGQDAWTNRKGRAGERGGARMGKPRCERILSITGGSSMAAMILKVPPWEGWGGTMRL
jgi:hypothetical protein